MKSQNYDYCTFGTVKGRKSKNNINILKHLKL